MPASDYTDLATLRTRLDLRDVTDETTIGQIITATSRKIDEWCGRRFYSVSETRYYTATDYDEIEIDDLLSVTALATDEDGDRTYETAWSASDYDLLPFNAALDGKPYTRIGITPNGTKSFPTIRRAVRVQGSFGYAASAPAVVREACLLQCARLFKRKDAPFGVVGSTELGQQYVIKRLDPDVEELLNGVKRPQPMLLAV